MRMWRSRIGDGGMAGWVLLKKMFSDKDVDGSHINPRYPDIREEFFSRAMQVEAEAGDVLMFSGPIQHCAMPNKSQMIRLIW